LQDILRLYVLLLEYFYARAIEIDIRFQKLGRCFCRGMYQFQKEPTPLVVFEVLLNRPLIIYETKKYLSFYIFINLVDARRRPPQMCLFALVPVVVAQQSV
jgi:hypothetical protein